MQIEYPRENPLKMAVKVKNSFVFMFYQINAQILLEKSRSKVFHSIRYIEKNTPFIKILWTQKFTTKAEIKKLFVHLQGINCLQFQNEKCIQLQTSFANVYSQSH